LIPKEEIASPFGLAMIYGFLLHESCNMKLNETGKTITFTSEPIDLARILFSKANKVEAESTIIRDG